MHKLVLPRRRDAAGFKVSLGRYSSQTLPNSLPNLTTQRGRVTGYGELAASRARPLLTLCATVESSTSVITFARENRSGNAVQNDCSTLGSVYISLT